MAPRSSQYLAVDTELPGERAGQSADLQLMSGTRNDSQLAHSPGSNSVSGAKPSNARTDIFKISSQSESRYGNGEQQQAAVERAESGRHATAMGIPSDSDCDLGQLLSEPQLWEAAWRAFEPHEAHSHHPSPGRLPSALGRDAVQGEVHPISFPSLAARLFGVGRRSRQREQRCARSRQTMQKCHLPKQSPACCWGRQASAARG